MGSLYNEGCNSAGRQISSFDQKVSKIVCSGVQHSSQTFEYLGPSMDNIVRVLYYPWSQVFGLKFSASQVQCFSLIPRHSKNRREHLVHKVRTCAKNFLQNLS